MSGQAVHTPQNPTIPQAEIFAAICDDLTQQSYSVQLQALPSALLALLHDRVQSEAGPIYTSAGIGRVADHHDDQSVRRDETAWIDDITPADHAWLAWMETLRTELNRQLFMGLTSAESHYARYFKGGFYARHTDAFTGAGNRKVSMVLFLNEAWVVADEGLLKLFVGAGQLDEILVSPQLGTLVVFLSDEIPHEVLPTTCTRHSIASWYR